MAAENDINIIWPGICHLGEGPVWNPADKKLYWTDILNSRLYVYDHEKNESNIFWEGDQKVGGLAFTKNHDIVICSDKGVFLLMKGSESSPKPLFKVPLDKNERFNDITVDPKGRIFAGTLDNDTTIGVLYRFEKNRVPKIVLRDIKCSNGMAFSNDNRYFYHTESMCYTIKKYSYDIETGEITDPVIFFKGSAEQGIPDGMTIDSEGLIWSAFWGSNTVKRFDHTGNIIWEIRFPAKQVSSVMFGGPDLKELFVTSSCQKADDINTGYNKDGVFVGGPTYSLKTEISGKEEYLADIY